MKLAPLAFVLAAVPLVGVVELALHAKQTGPDQVPDTDWTAARDLVQAEAKSDDLVLFAPFWADPLGREHFGDALVDMKKEGRPDETRYPRAFEVSIRGHHRSELDGWKKISERSTGKVTVSLYENPAPAKVLTDLVDLARSPAGITVTRVENGAEQPCTFQHGPGQPGGLGVPQGPAIPGDRFVCGSGYVGVAVLHALDHHPHLCIHVAAAPLVRIKFPNVTFGSAIHGHSGVQWLADRTPTTERITLSFSAEGRPLGTNPHKVGTGWTLFEFPTPELAGKRGDLVAEVQGGVRNYCFEADTR